ncbi:MAGUK p55 subfamily member 4-like [Polymixia lowei]
MDCSQYDNGVTELLSSVLEEVGRAVSRDISGAQLLHGLLNTPWLHALLKVYECLLQFQRLSPCPFLPYASGLSHEVIAMVRAQPRPSAHTRELYNILTSPHMQALLSCHDSVAQSDYGPVLPPLPDELPEDEEAMRIVCLVKNKQPLGATIKRDEETGEIHIARVIHGGLADRSGLLHPGDLLVEVNGNPVEGLEPEQVIQILIQSQGTILFKVIPNITQPTSSHATVYMRAMVDYCPLQDLSIPCPDAGMAFSRGEFLEVVDQTDHHWWQARKLPSTTSCAGLIPSTIMLKSKQREQWWCQSFHAHTCIRALTLVHNEDDSKPADEKCVKADEEDIIEAESDVIDGVYLAGFRRSFRQWRRTAYRRRRQSCYSCSPNNSALSNPYEEVVTYQRPPQDNHRLIVLVGASGVGVNELRKRLIKLNSSSFQGPVPHTTRPIREGEETGREYHYITKELFEYMVCNNRFLEYGDYKGYLYGTSSDSIREVQKTGRMCIIDVEPHSIQPLRTRKLKPFIIFIKPPSLERLRQTRKDAHFTTNHTTKRPLTDEDFEETLESSRLIELKYRQFFDSIIVNENLQDACMELFSVIQQAQEEPQWIPAHWMRQVVMPTVKSKKKKPKKEVNDGEEHGEVGLEMELEEVANRRQSESRDPLTPEPQDPAPQKKKKKKKAPIDQEVDHADMPNGDLTEPITDGEETTTTVTRKTKRKRKAKATEHYSNDLGAEDDDIITDVHPSIPQHALFSAPLGHSQPVGKVFVERNRRFQAERVDLNRHPELMEDYMEVRQLWTTRDVAMRVHSGFRVLGLFSHGFLAGYAVWNIIVVYVLAGEQLTTLPNLLQQYHPLAYPAQSLLYLLLAVSTVSAFDRVNLAKASMALRGFLTLDPAALASFLYFIALILSLSQQMTSDRIHLYPTANQTLWPPGSEHQILQPWIVVNLVVALLVGLAWAFVSTHPEIDYTEDFLMAMEVESYPRDDNLDVPA